MMKVFENNNATAYRTCCECHSDDHNLETWIEVGDATKDITELRSISIAFYIKTYTPWWNSNFNRFKIAWKLLTTGYYGQSQYFLMNEQTAKLFIDTLTEDMETLRNVNNQQTE